MRLRMSFVPTISNAGAILRSPAAAAAGIAMLATLGSCNTTGCTDNRSSLPLAGFYSNETGAAISLDILEIGGIGAPGDSLLLAPGEHATEVYLPLRSEHDSASFFIAYRTEGLDDPALVDTISFAYDAFPYFASEECGAMMRYRIRAIDYTRHLLDSVAVAAADSVITNAPVQNLHLYFKTSTAER
ncbi:MAG: hypothetical protein HDS69_06765 [Bacteroidales bacterium]|nr:hypothetical protein [Bacteroidales bacterium]MBD5235784.1 hypothetical protein [Barnesiella sp.]